MTILLKNASGIKIFILFMCLSCFAYEASAQGKSLLQQTVQLSRSSGTIAEFLNDLSKNQNIRFFYDAGILPDKKLKLSIRTWKLKSFLRALLKGTNVGFDEINGQVVFKKQRYSKVTISGTIKGKADGEHLIGATVYIKELGTGTTSNLYGFYSLTVPPGEYTFVYAYMGYKSIRLKLNLSQNLVQNVALKSQIAQLGEVVVKATREQEIEGIESSRMSAHSMKVEKIKATPMVGGEADILKTIQYLPGIQSASTGTSSFSVRGGAYDQNLILLDDAPVYNVSHVMGLFSVFNVDAIKDVKVYKGAMPARYGGRLSSVVDVRMKEGNDKKFSLSGGVGLVSSRLTVEGPIGHKVSFLVSGRYGYVGQTANQLAQLSENFFPDVRSFGKDNEISFYDLNAKFNVKLNDNNKIYLSAFAGNDHFFNNVVFQNNTLNWGNQTASFRWNHIFNSKLFGNLTLTHGNFDYAYQVNGDARNFKWEANMQQRGAKLDFDYFASPASTFRFGASLTHHKFLPGKITPVNDSSIVVPFSLDTRQAIETGLYLNHELSLGKRLLIDYGLRFSSFHNLGNGVQYIYNDKGAFEREQQFAANEIMNSEYGIEPRLSIRYLLGKASSMKASYSRTYQYLHLVSTSTVGLPTDVWLPVDNNIKPRMADQIALGYFRNFKEGMYSLSAETYYKKIYQVIDYKDNASIFLNKNIETQIKTGEGKAYGIEFLLEKKKGKFTGMVSYTLAKVERQIDGINNNKTYAPSYDRRHNLTATLAHTLGKRWQVSASYSYISGVGVTVPQGVYVANNRPFNYYSGRNNYKLRDFHQLDLNVTLKSKNKRRWRGEWVFGVTNAYNQKNPFSVYMDHTANVQREPKTLQLFLFGLMPSVNYNFKF